MKVIAHGVETDTQLGFLRRNQCDMFQGHLFGEPMTAEDAGAVLRRRYLRADAFAATKPDRTLLLLDDEENILRSLVRLFRRDGYRILAASNVTDAFELLATNDVQVILSDQRMSDIGWWQAWQSKTTSSGKSPSRLRFGSSSTSSSSRAASAWPIAQTRTASWAPLRFCQSSSTTKCGGSVCEKVSSSKLIRGCPAPIMRCVTNLSLLPKWHDRQSRACARGWRSRSPSSRARSGVPGGGPLPAPERSDDRRRRARQEQHPRQIAPLA